MVDIFSMKVMKIMNKFGIIEIAFWVTQTWLLAIPEFHLPAGTPGRQEIFGTHNPYLADINGERCEHVIVPGTTCELFFPIDGSQPSTPDAGEWSGARYTGNNNAAVTDWWIRVFGGDTAIELANRRRIPQRDNAITMGFDSGRNAIHIIRAKGSLSLKWQIWETFYDIASDPIGRVLLYRLFIEIRRIDNTQSGCCEAGIHTITGRNKLRSIEIKFDKGGFGFGKSGYINFDPADKQINTMIFNPANGQIATANDGQFDTLAVGLFHEMLHWFHALRHLRRYDQSALTDPTIYRYLLRSYYGDVSELYTWGPINDEEIRTILGTPNYNDLVQQPLINREAFLGEGRIPIPNLPDRFLPNTGRFLEGDDLSENTFRLSTHLRGRVCHMRFGHAGNINWCPINNRFRLANYVAKKCYSDITTIPVNRVVWDIGNGATQ